MMRVVSTFVVLVAALAVVAPAQAHICMWQPRQRAGFSIAGPAQNPCYRKVGPCGTDVKGDVTTISAGQPYTVAFQQNANHYYTGKPGSLVVDWAKGSNPTEEDFKGNVLAEIQDYNAMGELTQTNFTRTVTIPDVVCDACVLRVRYVSNNPLEDPEHHGPTFYQCADVEFAPSSKPADETAAVQATKVPEPAHDDDAYPHKCCAPASFTTDFIMMKPMTTSKGKYYYDNTTKFMREDVVHGDGTGNTAANGKFTIISNFTSGDGYYLNVNTGKCELGGPFGLDLWNEWCFGSFEESEKYSRSGACYESQSHSCNYYTNGLWEFGATADGQCFPASITGSSTAVASNQGEVHYMGAKAGPIDPSLFNPPAACLKAKAEAEAAAKRGVRRALSATIAELAPHSLTAMLLRTRE